VEMSEEIWDRWRDKSERLVCHRLRHC
jgi:hypothetical protein